MTFLSTQTFDDNGEVRVFTGLDRKATLKDFDKDTGVGTAQIASTAKTESYTAEDAIPFGNALGAEAHVLTEGEVFWGVSTPPIRHIAEENRSGLRISNAMANIATHSKRGFGNTVIYNPVFAEAIEQAKTALKTIKVPQPGPNFEEDPEDVELVDQEVPYFEDPDAIAWIEHANAPDDKVLVLYRGTDDTDQPLIWVEGTGLIMNSKMAAVETYGKFTKVT